ncbi:MAG: hypothetical protein QW551_07290 [Desulfurococcaceae archaeon]
MAMKKRLSTLLMIISVLYSLISIFSGEHLVIHIIILVLIMLLFMISKGVST